ncbi:hypothetical protein [Nocardia brevicatena]|uniref:hypothetical protein n=1 Tax=Nocardia brevicatena TaxID=37327 RepID=UPI0002E1F10A|nr:hypothetical protein [Nocardia brevicatena]
MLFGAWAGALRGYPALPPPGADRPRAQFTFRIPSVSGEGRRVPRLFHPTSA